MKIVALLLPVFLLSFLIRPLNTFGADLLIIDSATGEPYKTVRESMLAELDSLGFRKDVNLNIKYWSLGNTEGMSKRVWLEEKNNHYDVIYISGTIAAINFHKFAFNNNKYTFVFGAVTDPVGIGIIDNFNSPPKSNFTGVCYPIKIENRLRFIRNTMPTATNVGFVYADMPQSQSYVKWIKESLTLDEFKDLKFHFRSVQFVGNEGGYIRMAMLAEKHILELNSKVDLFLSPNDQMGVQKPFAESVFKVATKPLIGLGKDDVMKNWGATMSIYPSMEDTGKQVAKMIYKLFTGTEMQQVTPECPDSGIAFDLKKVKQFNISIPENLLEEAGPNIIR